MSARATFLITSKKYSGPPGSETLEAFYTFLKSAITRSLWNFYRLLGCLVKVHLLLKENAKLPSTVALSFCVLTGNE